MRDKVVHAFPKGIRPKVNEHIATGVRIRLIQSYSPTITTRGPRLVQNAKFFSKTKSACVFALLF